MVNLDRRSQNQSQKTTADKKAKENGSSVTTDSSSHHSGRKGHDYSSKKGVKAGRTVGENEPSKFRDPPGDASLDDLFQPNDKLDDRSAEASTSASSSHVNQGQSNRGDILHLMMGVLKEDVISIDGLAVEFGKLLATQIFIPLPALESLQKTIIRLNHGLGNS
ncbi:hypothetical protein Tco_0296633 [Tanacetum coccineum]